MKCHKNLHHVIFCFSLIQTFSLYSSKVLQNMVHMFYVFSFIMPNILRSLNSVIKAKINDMSHVLQLLMQLLIARVLFKFVS